LIVGLSGKALTIHNFALLTNYRFSNNVTTFIISAIHYCFTPFDACMSERAAVAWLNY